MYRPPAYDVTEEDAIADQIARSRLGLLITHGPQGLVATHLPFLWDVERRVLSGHLARANPHRTLDGGGEALAVLPGPEAYVSPSWYPSKAEDGRQVPTWNYEAVHLYGRLTWIDDRERLLDLVSRLSDRHEAGRPRPWTVAEAPRDYVERLLGAIVGVELSVARIEAKAKLSQNKPARDRDGVRAGLEASDDPRDRAVAERMKP